MKKLYMIMIFVLVAIFVGAPAYAQDKPESFSPVTISTGMLLTFLQTGTFPDTHWRLSVRFLPQSGRNRVSSYGRTIFGSWSTTPAVEVDVTPVSCSVVEITEMPFVCYVAPGVVQIYSNDPGKHIESIQDKLLFLPVIKG